MSVGGEQQVTLVSCNNAKIVIGRRIAERSMLLKNMIEDLSLPYEELIPLKDVSEAVLCKILE